ncbi:MAG: nucleoside-diphosphate sugar epimerase/dehydratase [Acidimicrobiia bacterium]
MRGAARLRADLSFAVIDAMTVVIAYTAALVLRFIDLQGVPLDWWQRFVTILPAIVAVHILANLVCGAYGHVWELASFEEAMRLVVATIIAGMVLLTGLVLIRTTGDSTPGPIPVMAMAVGAGLTLGGMGAARFRARLFSFKRRDTPDAPPATLVVGTGRNAAQLARYGGSAGEVMGFVTPNGTPSTQRLAGRPVLGTLEDLPRLVEIFDAQQIVIADPLTDDQLRALVDACIGIDVRLSILPGFDGSEPATLRDVRDLALTDLLPRDSVHTDLTEVGSLLEGKRVLITGGGGSIGSEIVRQVLSHEPGCVYVLDNDETHLYDALLPFLSAPNATAVLADIRDRERMMRLVEEISPDIVFHAAAHKHVPILESHPDEAAQTNVLGTRNLLDACRRSGVARFVLISTDKAVEPSSVMGASKRVAEMLVQVCDRTSDMVCSAVRFGNVLGSRGSVIPTFMRQIQQGGPVTVSDPDMLRYFMTVDEAVQLVLQAAAISDGGEVFVLDMGEPLRIGELARRMIRLAGLVPGRDIKIEITGIRPGEKMFERLSSEPMQPSRRDKISVASPGHPGPVTLSDAVATLGRLADESDHDGIREVLMSLAWNEWDGHETIQLDLLSTVDEEMSA